MALAKRRISEYLRAIRWLAVVALINALAGDFFYNWIPTPYDEVAFNLVRAAIYGCGGWLLVRAGFDSLWWAATAGFVLNFVDHPIAKGGLFLADGERMAFYGVMLSFVMFVAIPMLVSVIGGYFAGRASVPSNPTAERDARKSGARPSL